MTPQRLIYLERLVWIVSFVGMTAAVAAFDWRVGLFFGALLLGLANADLPFGRRRG